MYEINFVYDIKSYSIDDWFKHCFQMLYRYKNYFHGEEAGSRGGCIRSSGGEPRSGSETR